MKENHPLQRHWDALLILYWRKDKRMSELHADFKSRFGMYPNEVEGLLRAGGYFSPGMHVRPWAHSWLQPLNSKLWEIDDNLRVLNWLTASTGLNCYVNKAAQKERNDRYYETKKAVLSAQAENVSRVNTYHNQNRMENFNRVKAVRSKR